MSSAPALSGWTSRMLKRKGRKSSTAPPPPPPPEPQHGRYVPGLYCLHTSAFGQPLAARVPRWIKAFASTKQGQVDREEITELRVKVSELEGERDSLREKLHEVLAREATRAASVPYATEDEAARRPRAEAADASYAPPSWSAAADDLRATTNISLQWGGVRRGDGEGYSWCLRGEGCETHQDQAAALEGLLSAAPGLWSRAAAVGAGRSIEAAETRPRAAEEEAAAEQEKVRLAEEKRLADSAREAARAKTDAEDQERMRLEVKAAAETRRRAAEEEAAAEQERVRLAEKRLADDAREAEAARAKLEAATSAEQERLRFEKANREQAAAAAEVATKQAAAAVSRKRPADSNPISTKQQKIHSTHQSGGNTAGPSNLVTHKGAAVFVCDENTFPEVIRRRLFGSSASTLHMYQKAVEQGMPLFLRNYTTNQILGPFEAVSTVQKNISVSAWGGRYSTQVRVNWGATGAQCQALRAVPVTSLAAFRGANRKKILLSQADTEELISALEQRGTVLVFAAM
mmetsp:Transcript_23958/g.64810  ORF Transcript_23958/g.64810 Transcript_23958/m.64810 type:complete len:518 (-) Transcript_23958:126-1679(-)